MDFSSTSSIVDFYPSISEDILDEDILDDDILHIIVDFYPSISEDLLTEALEFGSQYDHITDEEKSIIIKAKNSLLFNGNTTWCKKTSNSLFDVTMGSFDGAETCELVGSYILSKLTPKLGHNIGLYRDDGLAAFDKTPREIENIKKYICTTFSEHNLN